jgi:hypothetical protein
MTKKDLIVNFVARTHGKNGARFTDIQKFIYEYNNPGMTYGRSNRGYYCCAFSSISYDGTDRRYLLKGNTCLVKIGELYFAKINGKILTPISTEHITQEVVWEN